MLRTYSLFSTYYILSLFFGINTQSHQRQVSFQTHDIPPENTKLHLKHIFHFGSTHELEDTKSSQPREAFKIMNVPKVPSKGHFVSHKEVDFKVLQKHIDSGGVMAFEEPNPDVMKLRKTILNLAKMAEHAYDPLPSTPWEDMEPGWHVNASFGWNKRSVRGYVFSDEDNKSLIISFKGTTFNVLPGDGATMPGDKESDNLMFSCCYGDAFGSWGSSGCSLGSKTCDNGCLDDHINSNTTYYHGAELIYQAIAKKYAGSDIMLVGHSLGGSLAALVGLANKKAAFSFEAPGEKLYAQRLGIDSSENGRKPFIFHHGHNADPLFLGTCNGRMSLCYLAGYGMDSQCHTSTTCVFDAVGKLGWSESLLHHRISGVVSQIYENWADGTLDINAFCKSNANCTDCAEWSYSDPNTDH